MRPTARNSSIAPVLILLMLTTPVCGAMTVSPDNGPVTSLFPDGQEEGSHHYTDGSDLADATGPGSRGLDDHFGNITGHPRFYASLQTIAGIGNPSGGRDGFLHCDLDGDGIDEVISNTSQGFIEVLDLARESPELVWRSDLVTGGVGALTIADLNGDGTQDVVVGGGSGVMHVFDGEGILSGNRSPYYSVQIEEQSQIDLIATMDVDDDTSLDVIVYSPDNQNITWVRNVPMNGSGRLLLEGNHTRPFTPSTPDVLMAEDIDGDDEGELLLAGFLDRTGTHGEIWTLTPENLTVEYYQDVVYPIRDMEVMDLDDDAAMEIVLATIDGVKIYDGTDLAFRSSMDPEWPRVPTDITIGDPDGDGDHDMVSLEWNQSSNSMAITLIDTTIWEYLWSTSYPYTGPSYSLMANVDPTDKMEYVIRNDDGLEVLEINLTGPAFYDVKKDLKVLGFNTFGLSSMDWDDDGITELVTGSKQGYISLVDPFTGRIEARTGDHGEWVNRAGLAVGDIDLDGEEEIVSGNAINISIFERDLELNTSFELDECLFAERGARYPIILHNMDNDNQSEILIGTQEPKVYVYDGIDLDNWYYWWNDNGEIRSMMAGKLDDNDIPDVVTGDTLGYVIKYKDNFQTPREKFHGYAPYGLEFHDARPGGTNELIVGDGIGRVHIMSGENLDTWESSEDLGSEIWGLEIADPDYDGVDEILAGSGDGWLYSLNISSLEVEWKVRLGEWIGSYNSLLARDLNGDGVLEIAAGSDGYVYVMRCIPPSEKPLLWVEEVEFPAATGSPTFEDGEVLRVVGHIGIGGQALNVTVGFAIREEDDPYSESMDLGQMSMELAPGLHEVGTDIIPRAGEWIVEVMVDPENEYSEADEEDNRLARTITVNESYAVREWFAGQGTALGRYGGMVIEDDDADGVPEIIVGNQEGFVQAYHLTERSGPEVIGHWPVDIGPHSTSDDMGHGTYGLVTGDVDSDGEVEVVVSGSEGRVTVLEDSDSHIEWRKNLSASPCYGLALSDLDMDGEVEVLAGCGDSRLYILSGPDGELEDEVTLYFELWAVAVADLKEDGRKEIVIGAQDGTVYILNATDLSVEQSFRLGAPSMDDLLVRDVDLDGSREIVYGDRDGSVFVIGLEPVTDGNGTEWRYALENRLDLGSGIRSLATGDLLPDRGIELVVATMHDIHVFNSTMHQVANMTLNRSITGMAVGDGDGDGETEILVGSMAGDLLVLQIDRGPEDPTLYMAGMREGLGSGVHSVALGDLDDDGAPDMVMASSDGRIGVRDGITKTLTAEVENAGSNIYGLLVRDVDDDGEVELVTGSGGGEVCSLTGNDLSVEWCTGPQDNWSIALAYGDPDRDASPEIVVGSGQKVFILDGSTGEVESSSFDLGGTILGLTVGQMDGDKDLEIAVGTSNDLLQVLSASNLTKEWGILLDGWPVGLSLLDTEGDGIQNVVAGTEHRLYEISHSDREVLWETDPGTGSWGLGVHDMDGDGEVEILAGLRDGTVISMNATSKIVEWTSSGLGSKAGWYNSLDLEDVDRDGQTELLIGSNGFVSLYSTRNVVSDPLPDVLIEKVSLPDIRLTHGQEINVTVRIYNHGLAQVEDLPLQALIDGRIKDTVLMEHLPPLSRTTINMTLTLIGGSHNLSVVADRYDLIEEFNEENNNVTISYIALLESDLYVSDGPQGIFFSKDPVVGIETTVFATVSNDGEQSAGGMVSFYWADHIPIGEAAVHVKGSGLSMASINWTPTEAGEWDLTVILEPSGVDGDMDNHIATRVVKVRSHPSVTVSGLAIPEELMDGERYSIQVMIRNAGGIGARGRLVLKEDGHLMCNSSTLIFPPGTTTVDLEYSGETGEHVLNISIQELDLDDDPYDNSIQRTVVVLSRPDVSFDSISGPGERSLVEGRALNIGAVIVNHGEVNVTLEVRAYDNGIIFHEEEIDLGPGGRTTVQVPWTPVHGHHEIELHLTHVSPLDKELSDNEAHLDLYVEREAEEDETNWTLLILLVVGFVAPLIAVLIYYSQVQPVRRMYAEMYRRLDRTRRTGARKVAKGVGRKPRKGVKRPRKRVRKSKRRVKGHKKKRVGEEEE